MFRELEYQSRVLSTLEYYLEQLVTQKAHAEEVAKLASVNQTVKLSVPDFTKDAWEEMRTEGRLPYSRSNVPFSPREDGAGKPVPNVTMKIPTGGGKTWLAVKSASMILNKYCGRNTGFVLWVVPNEAIYSQTLRNFKNREHPYRWALDRAAAGKVKILTKKDRLNAVDVDTHLCVMVLMLQSANRQTKETLKIFRERGDVHGFVPPEGEQDKHRDLANLISNLDCHGGGLFTLIKDSLGNALRIIRPVVVMDEGHKAVSDLAYETLYSFNPSFVLELTATPKDVRERKGENYRPARFANLLVEITGKQLDREGMIKMPLILDQQQATDWQTVLNASVERLDTLQQEATIFEADSNRYIRPILLIQVERTGSDQRDSNNIHTDDVREYLLQTGFDEAEIAIKTAEQNDFKLPENQNLLSPYCPVRVIITRDALQEGWDCPFAYVLCSLAARSALSAMTQLTGRILRQPHAAKTGVEGLDQCYVFTHRAATNLVVEKIKNGLQKDGLGDLVMEIASEDRADTGISSRRISRREQFRKMDIFLPQVLINRDGDMKPLDYETDILTRIDWREFDNSGVSRAMQSAPPSVSSQLISVHVSDNASFIHHATERRIEQAIFDPVQAVQQISDIILNPFVAWTLVEQLIKALEEIGFDESSLGLHSTWIVEALRKELLKEQDKRAEVIFKKAVNEGQIQFRLRADGKNWKMPETIAIDVADHTQLSDKEGNLMEKNLFERVYKIEFNQAEREVAVYLDGQKALGWWHRNVAKRDYGLKGWKKNVVYPDLIFSVKKGGKTGMLVALETKGDFLDGTEDTNYKRDLMEFLTKHFAWDNTAGLGQLELQHDGSKVVCDLVLMDEWPTKLPEKYFT